MKAGTADAAVVGCLKTLLPGRRILLWYTNDNVWHEIIVGMVATESLAAIYTPDSDLYLEDLTCSGVDGPSRLRSLGPRMTLPRNLRARAYGFRAAVTDDDIRKIILDSAKLIESEGHTLVLPDDVVDSKGTDVNIDTFFGGSCPLRVVPIGATGSSPQTPKNALVVRPALGDSVWLAAEPLGGLLLGQEVSLNEETDVQCGDRFALALRQGEYVKVEMVRISDAADYAEKRRQLFSGTAASSGSSDDKAKKVEEDSEVRTLWVDFDEHGDRFKRWRDVVKESYTPSFDEKPLEGPATGLHLIKHAERHGGDPRLWLQLWARAKHIEVTDRVHHELKVLTDCLYFAGTHDQLNIPALVSMEIVCRRVQAIVDAYSHASKPSWENAKIFTGQGTPEDIVSPSFRTYAAKKNKDELELLQARQKVRELRVGGGSDDIDIVDGLPSKPPKGPKAKPKGGPKGGGGQADS